MNIAELVEPIVALSRKAGDSILKVYATDFDVQAKDDESPLTQADMASHKVIEQGLRDLTPDLPIISEESGLPEFEERRQWDRYWLIDPLDGTTNFLHGFPQFSVSIALKHRGRLDQAVVYDPMRQELFTASRGSGAFLDNRRIRVSKQNSLTGALLGTGFPYKDQQHLHAYLEMFKALIVDTAGIRRPGSAALDLAYVAAGRFDGFWEIGLNAWDMAAGVLLVREAGGLVGDLGGGHDFLQTGNIVAAAPKLFPLMLREIRPHLSDTLAH